MVAAKEIVGEQYHIHGVGLRMGKDGGVELGSRINSLGPQNAWNLSLSLYNIERFGTI